MRAVWDSATTQFRLITEETLRVCEAGHLTLAQGEWPTCPRWNRRPPPSKKTHTCGAPFVPTPREVLAALKLGAGWDDLLRMVEGSDG